MRERIDHACHCIFKTGLAFCDHHDVLIEPVLRLNDFQSISDTAPMATGTYSILLLWLSVIIAILITNTVADDIVYVTVTTTVEAAKTVQATPTAQSPASYTSLNDFKKTVLRISNDYRKAHDAQPLVWNETLTEYAQKWAETCIWKHSVCIRACTLSTQANGD